MRGNVNGAVLALVLWVIVAWSVVCIVTWLDDSWSSSASSLLKSLACVICAASATMIWMLHDGDAQPEAVRGSDPVARTKPFGEE